MMLSIARSIYLEAQTGVHTALPKAGSTLEHPLVYDSVARELKALSDQGMLRVTLEHKSANTPGSLIDRFEFVRLPSA